MDFSSLIQSKIINRSSIGAFIEGQKKSNKKIVFTNGCFDVIHFGHVDYLSKARNLGGFLVIGLNSDASVKRLKGDSRPINQEYARAFVLAAMAFVDAVVVFDEDTPKNLVEDIIPDVLVKGGDYEIENIVGADCVLANGGSVELIKFVDGFSSSKIIKKL